MTIPRNITEAADPVALALAALGWVMADNTRAERFLALTGLTPDALRAGLREAAARAEVLGAVLDFLAAHEPDLLGAADALAVAPAALIAVRDDLGHGGRGEAV